MATNSPALIVQAPSTNAVAAVETTLQDIKAPVHIPDYWMWLWIAVGLLVAVAIGFLLWKFWLKKKFAPVPVAPIPPHIRARRKLKEAFLLLNEPKLFTSAVSDALRIYLEERFELRAPERTTEEFLHELQSTSVLNGDQKKSLGDFLERCDMVKFARYEPTQSELEDLHNAAMRLVEETEPQVVATESQIQNTETK